MLIIKLQLFCYLFFIVALRYSKKFRDAFRNNYPVLLFELHIPVVTSALEYIFKQSLWGILFYQLMALATAYFSSDVKPLLYEFYRMICAVTIPVEIICMLNFSNPFLAIAIFIGAQFYFKTRISQITLKYPVAIIKLILLCAGIMTIFKLSLSFGIISGWGALLWGATLLLLACMLAQLFNIPLPFGRGAIFILYENDILLDLFIKDKVSWTQQFSIKDIDIDLLSNPIVYKALLEGIVTYDKLHSLDLKTKFKLIDQCDTLPHLIAILNLVNAIERISPEHIQSDNHSHYIDEVNGDEGKTALILAIEAGHGDIVKALLKYGANPNFVVHSHFQRTPFYYAIKGNHIDIIKTLFTHGANPNQVTPHNECALYWAAKQENPTIALWLIGMGASRSDRIYTIASMYKNHKTLKALQKPLLAVSTHDDIALVQSIVNISKTDDFESNHETLSPIINAYNHGKTKNMRIMLLKNDYIMNQYAHTVCLKPIRGVYTKVVQYALLHQDYSLYIKILVMGRLLPLPFDVYKYCLQFIYGQDELESLSWLQFVDKIPKIQLPYSENQLKKISSNLGHHRHTSQAINAIIEIQSKQRMSKMNLLFGKSHSANEHASQMLCLRT